MPQSGWASRPAGPALSKPSGVKSQRDFLELAVVRPIHDYPSTISQTQPSIVPARRASTAQPQKRQCVAVALRKDVRAPEGFVPKAWCKRRLLAQLAKLEPRGARTHGRSLPAAQDTEQTELGRKYIYTLGRNNSDQSTGLGGKGFGPACHREAAGHGGMTCVALIL
uniref:Uncharacterized protein n=1 Tax=Anopheles coluzzii TaxID=1518534 RepID=A0A8W7P7J1_ANOCL